MQVSETFSGIYLFTYSIYIFFVVVLVYKEMPGQATEARLGYRGQAMLKRPGQATETRPGQATEARLQPLGDAPYSFTEAQLVSATPLFLFPE